MNDEAKISSAHRDRLVSASGVDCTDVRSPVHAG
jgi:hypothetical protein